MKKICLVILAIMLLMLTSCDNKEPIEQYSSEELVAYANIAPALTAGRTVVLRFLPSLCYYDNYSYTEAKKKALLSPELKQKYFPSEEYMGDTFNALPKEIMCKHIGIAAYDDSSQTYILDLIVKSQYGASKYIYAIDYSTREGCIVEVNELIKY